MLENAGATPVGPGRVKLVQVLDGDGPPPVPEGQAWGEIGVCEICLHVRGVQAVFDALVAAGCEPLMEPVGADVPPTGVTLDIAYVADPWGTKLELIEWTGLWRSLPGPARAEGVNVRLELSGKRAIAYYRYQGFTASHTYTQFEDKPRFEDVEVLANRYIADYIAKRIDRVDVAYMKFLSAARQTPMVETLLPLSTAAPTTRKGETVKGSEGVEYEFIPSAADILQEILPMSFKIRLFKCFLDAAVSEQIARRVAMKAATENAGEMIRALTLQYNRARQAQITKEIAEIIGGAAALE